MSWVCVNMGVQIVTSYALAVVDEYFDGRLDPSELSSLKAAVNTAAATLTDHDGRLVDEEQFLRLCVEHWHMHEEATKKVRGKGYHP